MLINVQEAMDHISENLQEQEGRFIVSFFDNSWVCAIEWGKEAPDSDIFGGAAYGTGSSMQEAIDQALNQTGWIND
jgi:hypothetical protein